MLVSFAQQDDTYETTKQHSDSSFFFYQQTELPRDCKDVRDQCDSNNSSGIYLIKPETCAEPFEVLCDNSKDAGGWTVSYMNFRVGDEFSNYKLVSLERNSGTIFQVTHFTDCQDAFTSGFTDNGIYKIKPNDWSGSAFNVYCNMTDGGGWTVFQRRVDGSVDFYRDWDSYKEGFGNLSSEFWLGNEQLHYLTKQNRYEIRIDVVNRDGAPYYAKFDNFRTNDETDNYRLSQLGTYSGTADERSNPDGKFLRYHLNHQFSTYDRDNDAYSSNCAVSYRGAWWYDNCYYSNFNGDYHAASGSYSSLYMYYIPGYDYNMKFTEMKIRPFRA
ncbi:hypothetical protein BSL78_14659 [Apostichopus japonicus]|uniref:Fibrinogen C-terminal domain-containing protein n=1 Tax=Stichopus japonicus TaxID=307972 RepID=A0A2G8KKG9_STIJA|nr:hypothetical protein BSL78_14659 [Apostichopus japonicus]